MIKLYPSAAERWMQCPGSAKLCENIPYQASKYADEGSLAHTICEYALTNKHIETMLGQKHKYQTGDYEVTGEMIDSAMAYRDLIRGIMAEHKVPDHNLVVEKYCEIGKMAPEVNRGKVDCLITSPEKAWVIDFKYGVGVTVSPEMNPQAMIYALAATKSLMVDEVEIIIVQPRAYTGDTVKRWQTSIVELCRWGVKTLAPAAKLAMSGEGPLVPGEWCESAFCPAKATCPARKSAALAAFPKAPKEPKLLTMEEIGKALEAYDLVVDWFKSVKEYAMDELKAGKEVPGWKLVNGKNMRKWADVSAAEKYFQILLGDAAYSKPELLSVAQMEKALKEQEIPTDTMAGHVVTHTSITMAPQNDKRPAIKQDAAQVFTALN